jgi:hypothetical protein
MPLSACLTVQSSSLKHFKYQVSCEWSSSLQKNRLQKLLIFPKTANIKLRAALIFNSTCPVIELRTFSIQNAASDCPLLPISHYYSSHQILLHRSRGSSVSAVTSLRTGRPRFNSRKCQWRYYFASLQRPDQFWGPPSFLSNGYKVLFHLGWNGRSVKLTTSI